MKPLATPLALALALVPACAAPYVAVPLAAHPSAAATGPSVGGSVGGVYGKSGDTHAVAVPYSEGWLRTGAGTGQLELHVAPNVAGLGYRYDLQPMTSGFGAAIEPMVAGGYFHESQSTGTGTSSTETQLAVAGSARLDLLFPTGNAGGFFYVSPVFGYTYVHIDETDVNQNHVDILTLGAAVGINLGGKPGMSLELSFHRLQDESDGGGDPLYIVSPSLGFQI